MIPLGVISSSSLSAFSLPPLGLVGHWDASKFSNFTPVNTWTDQTGLGDMVVPSGAYGFDARVPSFGGSTSLQGYYIVPKTGGKLHRSMPPSDPSYGGENYYWSVVVVWNPGTNEVFGVDQVSLRQEGQVINITDGVDQSSHSNSSSFASTFIVTSSNGGKDVFRNGTLLRHFTAASPLNLGSSRLTLGGSAFYDTSLSLSRTSSKYFEVALYNRTLTTSEVSSIHSYAKAKWSL